MKKGEIMNDDGYIIIREADPDWDYSDGRATSVRKIGRERRI